MFAEVLLGYAACTRLRLPGIMWALLTHCGQVSNTVGNTYMLSQRWFYITLGLPDNRRKLPSLCCQKYKIWVCKCST